MNLRWVVQPKTQLLVQLKTHLIPSESQGVHQAGPLTHTVEDAELIHSIISGTDSYDATTLTKDTYPEVPVKDKCVFGVPRKFLADGIDPDVLDTFNAHVE